MYCSLLECTKYILSSSPTIEVILEPRIYCIYSSFKVTNTVMTESHLAFLKYGEKQKNKEQQK